ncbi:hypothetical protein U6A24_20100 [Aquimarina gracilis]|uniref:Nuclear transport factor 2 family protein n=1 Tax=Aquimarina gracilis TaxID=874422 RepID=A0ABU6A128_9FLAO|nr:hypothetical protein [Aquimarina gracilis]MEB3347791.1 hypothetical protein [Aquimarina gracilis]
MKNYLIILLFISGSVFSQNIKTLKKSALRDAKAATQASVDKNLSNILKYTHPKVYKAYGEKQLMETMDEIFRTMDAQNIKIVSSKIDEISDIRKENREYRCLAKTTTKMNFNGRSVTLKSSLFGFYNDKNSQWYFVESNKLLDDPETQKLFPKFKTEIEIPIDEHIEDN